MYKQKIWRTADGGLSSLSSLSSSFPVAVSGVPKIVCGATSSRSFDGDHDAADFLFAHCPGATAPPSVPYRSKRAVLRNVQ